VVVTKALVIAVCLLVGVPAVAAIAQEDEEIAPPGAEVQQVATVEPEAAAAAAVLETPRTAADAMPADVAEALDEKASFGMNPDLSRAAVGGTSAVYLIPADGHVCATLTVGEGANISCAPTDRLAEGDVGPSTVSMADGRIAVFGMVPDGIEQISIEAGRDSMVAEVGDNGYLAVLPRGAPVETVSYAGPSGRVEFAIYDPAAP
jgi:hypothetical protein